MKLREKCAQVLLSIYKWLMVVLCGISVAVVVVAAFYKLLDRMEGLTIFAIVLAVAVGFFALHWWRIQREKRSRRARVASRRHTDEGKCEKCEKCGVPLCAFHYYRDNFCFAYCEKCGKPYQATHAAPYRTIELCFSGIQREGRSLTVEVENWPSLERCYLRWYEWNETGGSEAKVDLPANYPAEHTVEEFMVEYLLKANAVTKRIPFSVLEGSLQSIKHRLLGSGVFYTQVGKSTAPDARNPSSEEKPAPPLVPDFVGYQMKMHKDSGEHYCFTLTGLKAYSPNTGSRCGSGSDDWLFPCKCDGESYILHFSDNAGFGTMWACAWISQEAAEQLETLDVAEWLKLAEKSETRILSLHPDFIDAAKRIVQDTASRCGPISDYGFYGH